MLQLLVLKDSKKMMKKKEKMLTFKINPPHPERMEEMMTMMMKMVPRCLLADLLPRPSNHMDQPREALREELKAHRLGGSNHLLRKHIQVPIKS